MRYLDVVTRVINDLRSDDDGTEPVQAGLQLAILAWRSLPSHDSGWDLFGLDVLAVADTLYPIPEFVVDAQPPDGHEPGLRLAVATLVEAVAQRLDSATRAEGHPLAERLEAVAAAVQLRLAVAALT